MTHGARLPRSAANPQARARRRGWCGALASAALATLGCRQQEADPAPTTFAGSSAFGSGATGGDGAGGDVGGGGVVDLPTGNQDCGSSDAPGVPSIQLTPIASGLDRPVYLTEPPGDSSRLFVVEKAGIVRIIQDGQLLGQPFLDIRETVDEPFEEMGLLGLAFHPDYQRNGRFYVYYSTDAPTGNTAPPHRSEIAEYAASGADPNVADAASARVVLDFLESEANHNGGDLEFGADGFLYVSSGDGGGANDQHGDSGNGQNLGTLLGKMLRIDVDGRDAGQYSVPAGNLGQAGALPEIWSYGLRNPWRFSFDACTGDMYVADVGQDTLEEVNFEPAGLGGRNYGWRLMEAGNCFNPESGCDAEAQGLTRPVASYGRSDGISITGGYVYRGSAIPELRGTYLYADYGTGNFFALRMSGGELAQAPQIITDNLNPGNAVGQVSSFGQDTRGEIYVVSLTGSVHRIDPE